MILAGDIGGTKTHLALFEDKKPLKVIREKKFQSSKYSNLNDIVREFLKSEKIRKATFGIAGPIKDGRCNATNLPWVIDAKELQKEIGIKDVFLINDLEANAYGIRALKPDEFFVLNSGIQDKEGNAALISAGTGLGEAGLFWDGEDFVPFASEGGHADFAPRDELEIELFWYLKKKYGHVSYERVVSGPAIYDLYQFLAETKKEKAPSELEKEFKEKDPSQVISKEGLKGKHKICVRALDLFISLYGAEAGNVALNFIALSGIYVGGGIAPKILEKITKGSFMESFIDKGRFSKLLQSIPVKIILNDHTALLGAVEYALLK